MSPLSITHPHHFNLCTHTHTLYIVASLTLLQREKREDGRNESEESSNAASADNAAASPSSWGGKPTFANVSLHHNPSSSSNSTPPHPTPPTRNPLHVHFSLMMKIDIVIFFADPHIYSN